ncbi:Qat anti-phage system TatD family nuclease QatD [Corallococcus carmarthensis]|uniref:Qat anti-phage system TatD family nuclease QatD n=1 Tax=Corallococcus carmarthensis TaxID=2316728 RepID=UPI00148C714A|nr:Qat anti-phage system TatD family nuclease QatD [Corallococcus carmarthensis]NOK20042.1 TatD family hydrolase [Corallococcus carmarthensis]
MSLVVDGHRRLVDTHCHVDLFPDPKALVERLEREGVYTIAVTNAPSVFMYTYGLAKNCRFVRAAAGLHPELVSSHGGEIGRLWSLLEQTRYVGEIGLDYSILDKGVRGVQLDVFEQILDKCASYGDKVLTIHSRRSASDVISAVGPNYPGRVILHWFSGTRSELRRAISCGFYFSANLAMASSKSGAAIISEIPRDRLLTESDGPFVKVSGEPATPLGSNHVLEAVAGHWNVNKFDVQQVVFENFVRLVS